MHMDLGVIVHVHSEPRDPKTTKNPGEMAGFLKRTMAEQNGESTPRMEADVRDPVPVKAR